MRRAIGLKFRKPAFASARKSQKVEQLPIRGIRRDMPVHFAKNASAVPGDRIVGIMEPGKGITIYPIHATDLEAFEARPETWLDIRWDTDNIGDQRYPAQIELTAINEPGTLAQIASVISNNDGNIDNLKMVQRTADYHEMLIDLEVFDLKHLNRIIEGLREKRVINAVARTST